MKTAQDWVLDDLQWFVLAGLLDHPQMSAECSCFWFVDKPLRMEMFKALSEFKCGPVCLAELYGKCQNIQPMHIASIADSPRPYPAKLERMIRQLETHIQNRQTVHVVRG